MNSLKPFSLHRFSQYGFSLYRLMAVLAVICCLSACGFQLRQSLQLPYRSMYLDLPVNSSFAAQLSRQLTGRVELVKNPAEAEVVFIQLGDSRTKNILSIDNQGLTREFQLRLNYVYRLTNAKGEAVQPVQQINISRDFSYSDAALFAKAQEETLLWRDINQDLIEQIVRRLSAVKKTQQ